MSKVKAIKKGQEIEGIVKSIQPFGAFVEIAGGVEGLVHVSEMSEDYNIKIEDFCTVGATVKVRALPSVLTPLYLKWTPLTCKSLHPQPKL